MSEQLSQEILLNFAKVHKLSTLVFSPHITCLDKNLHKELYRDLVKMYGYLYELSSQARQITLGKHTSTPLLNIREELKFNKGVIYYVNEAIKPYARTSTYTVQNFTTTINDFEKHNEIFSNPLLVIPIKQEYTERIRVLLEYMNIPFRFENNFVFLCHYNSIKYRTCLLISVIAPLTALKSHLPNFSAPKVGQSYPRVSYIDCPENQRITKILNFGLGYVYVAKKWTDRDLFELQENLSKIINDDDMIREISERITNSRSSRDKYGDKITKKDMKFLNKSISNLVIKPADKGGKVVVMSSEFYSRKISQLIDNSTDYEMISKEKCPEPLERCMTTVRNVALNIIKLAPKYNEFLSKICNSDRSRLGVFYGLPKIHKSVQDPPMRPVVSQVNHPTYPLASKLDMLVQYDLFSRNKHLLRSTDDALNKLTTIKGLTNHYLLTLDVKSLYTSIPLDEGIQKFYSEAGRWFKSANKVQELIFIKKALPCILYNNYFEFGDKIYRQTKGVAMGSPIGPSFANTFMLHIDRVIMEMEGVVKYFRYIDDILIVLEKYINLEEFLEIINGINKNILFENEGSTNRIDFLDLTLEIIDGQIKHTIYEKEISSKERYIHKSSLHNKHMLQGVVIGSVKRALKLCSSAFSSFCYINHTLRPRFLQQGITNEIFAEKTVIAMLNKKKTLLNFNRDITGYITIKHNANYKEDIETIRSINKSKGINIKLVHKDYITLRRKVVKAKFK